jgi:hypothetical protein
MRGCHLLPADSLPLLAKAREAAAFLDVFETGGSMMTCSKLVGVKIPAMWWMVCGVVALSGCCLPWDDCDDPPPERSTTCSHSLRSEGSISHPEIIQQIDLIQNTLIVGDGGQNLHLVDLSDPAAPQAVASADFLAPIDAFAISGEGYALAVGTSGGDTESPVHTARVLRGIGGSAPEVGVPATLPARGVDVAWDGDHAIVAMAGAGVSVLDMTIRSRPIRKGTLAIEGDAHCVAVKAGIGFVGTSEPSRVQAFDLRDPDQPVALDALDFDHAINALALSGNRLMVAGSSTGLTYIDVEDPSEWGQPLPTLANRVVSDLAIADGYVYVPLGDRGLQVFDATRSNPAGAVLQETIGNARLVGVSPDFLCVVNDRWQVLVYSRMCVEGP